jgi:tetratricopeptide (TPR) repeat protein
LNAQLDDFRQKSSSVETEQAKLDPEQAEKLRALGYLATDGGGINGEQKSAIDPKDKVEVARKFHRALADIGEDHYDEAIANLRDVVRLEPEMGSAYLELGRALVHNKQDQEALPMLRMAVEKLPDSGIPHYELGLLLVKNKDWEAALKEMQAAVVCTPHSALLHFDLAAVLTRLKRVNEAVAEYEKALEIDPDYFEANLTYGRLLLLEGHPEDALPKLSSAVKAEPESAEAHASLADAYEKLGQVENASAERVKASQLKAQQPE